MAWHIAAALETLRKQLNARAPRRSTASDGGVGDAAHASRASDHNPWYRNTVTARDFTHDPGGGLDCNWLADTLVRNRDPRIKYIIWNRRIWQGGWAPYHGANPHTKHLHLSVVASPACEATTEWVLGPGGAPPAGPPAVGGGGVVGVLQKGSRGPAVRRLQEILTSRYPAYARWSPVTEYFGDQTRAAVIEFQRRSGLTPDGIVGPKTRAALHL
jgi:hypothetical protein